MSVADLKTEAVSILRTNDRGGYTVPTARLYPYQWNWDSGFTALGWATFDEARAWREIERLFEGQWTDGLVPHIIFHQESSDYFPGPDVWQTSKHDPATSGISQPPVVATMVRKLLEASPDPDGVAERVRALYPKMLAYHRWWWQARDPEDTGLVVILHPWESGMDNSPAWDGALTRVPPPRRTDYVRRDTSHVDAAERPRAADYDRYISLVEGFVERGYEAGRLYRETPFRVADISINAILLRATEDLAILAERFGTGAERAELAGRIALMRQAIADCWSPGRHLFQSVDRVSGERIDHVTSAGFLPLYAGVPTEAQAAEMAAEMARWGEGGFLVPTVPHWEASFDSKRYWRGPVWAVVNFMLADGLARCGQPALSARIRADTRVLIERAGFAEYFDPRDGSGRGGGTFSWTAAVGLAWALE